MKKYRRRQMLCALVSSTMLCGQMLSLPIAANEPAIQDESLSRTLDNTGGDNIVYLDSLGSAKEFRFSADVTLTDYESGQQSAALLFGVQGTNSNFANFHGKIDWNVPVRAWGYAFNGDQVIDGPAGQDNTWLADHNIDLAQPVYMAIEVVQDQGAYRFTYSLNGTTAITCLLNNNYDGGKFGLMTYASTAQFDNISLEVLDTVNASQEKLNQTIEAASKLEAARYTDNSYAAVAAALAGAQEAAGSDDAVVDAARASLLAALDALVLKEQISPSDFKGAGNGRILSTDSTLTLKSGGGDYFSVLSSMEKPANAFVLETDVNFPEGGYECPALLFGLQSRKTPNARWYGANMDSGRGGRDDLFRVFGPGFDHAGGQSKGIDLGETIHLRLEMRADGHYTYTYGNAWGVQYTMENTVPDWAGGYVGLLAFNSTCTFSRIYFEDNTVEDTMSEIAQSGSFVSDLGALKALGGTWSETADGLLGSSQSASWVLSEEAGKDSVYSADISFPENKGTAGLSLRFNNSPDAREGYGVYLNGASHTLKLVRWQDNTEIALQEEIAVEPAETYHIEATSIGGRISVTVNGVLKANTGDYTLQYDDRGQNTIAGEGHFGLLVRQGSALFQNVSINRLVKADLPVFSNVTVHTDGTIESAGQFFTDSPIYTAFVKQNCAAAWIEPEGDADTIITMEDEQGNPVNETHPLSLADGHNWIVVKAEKDGVILHHRISVYRYGDDAFYYNEPHRSQYHYSIKEGWINDPHGVVYYKGKYHMFQQFYPGTQWGPMHWWHITSTDLIHWESQGLAMYPDMNGMMFNGDIVPDETNASGLFSTDEGGLVALITADGNGQRLKLAISEDEGMTWKKLDDIAVDWTDDPLMSMDFRDPNIFRWEGKWFMVIAGGPLRIYSSDDLVHWQAEAVYGNLHTECPDLYPQEIDGQIKWILDEGGRLYKVGDFKEVDGVWTFVPDKEYETYNGIMNFGKDSYAAITPYIQDFGTAENPTIPDIMEINWMNTWDDYCRIVADTVGQKFNGTYNLTLKVGLTKDNGMYRMTQQPLEAYKDLRDTAHAVVIKDAAVSETANPLSALQGSSYELVSRFYPEEGTKEIGFRLRTGDNGQYTEIRLNLENDVITCDRSHSGIQISGRFSQPDSQDLSSLKAVRNDDGSIDLHVYVDRASVELYAANYEAAGGWQIFSDPTSTGLEAFAKGQPCRADFEFYPMNSIWQDKAEVTEPYYIGTSAKRSAVVYAGETVQLSAYVMPVESGQDLVWSSSNEAVASVDANGLVTARRKGNAVITCTSAGNPGLSLTFDLSVNVNGFQTNAGDFTQAGNWYVDGEELICSNQASNDYYLSNDTFAGDMTYEADVCYRRGLVNLFFAGASASDPFAQGGTYAVQLTQDSALRLFRFGGADLGSAVLDKPLNDGQYHHIAISRSGSVITVKVDDKEVLSQAVEGAEDFFSNGHIGFGLWDGEARFQNLMVTLQHSDEQADKTLLAWAVEYAGLAKADPAYQYVHETVKAAFEAALTQANAVLADDHASQQEVDAAWKELTERIHMLSFTADKSRLLTLLVQAENIAAHPEDYEGDMDAFQAALEAARAVYEDENALDARIEAAASALEEAMNALQAKELDTTLLALLISVCEQADESDYLEAGWSEFAAALEDARAVLAAPQSQAQINEAVSELNDKWLALRLKPSEELLNTLRDFVKAADTIDRSAYSAEQLACIDEAKLTAQKALEDPNLDLPGAEKAVKGIQEAQKIIESVSAGKAGSNTASTAAPAASKSQASSVKTAAASHIGFWSALGAAALAVLLKKRSK